MDRENLGWDLEVRSGGREVLLELEVKGLYGSDLQIGLTPNEYRVLNEHESGNRGQYRLCVVTNALSKHPKLHVFNHHNGSWHDDIGGSRAALTITPLTAAIVRLASGPKHQITASAGM